MAAIARLSNDATSFTKVFQYHDTQSPVGCSADTPVGNICPMVWQKYADQLGIDLSQRDKMPPAESGGCQMGSRSAPLSGLFALLSGLCGLLLSRRRSASDTRKTSLRS